MGRDKPLLGVILACLRTEDADPACPGCDTHKAPGMLIQVKGTPRPQPRPRFGRGRAVSCADQNARRWIAQVELEARRALQVGHELKGALAVRLVFRMPTKDKARLGLAHLATPDADNLAKLALDCFQRTGLLANDSAVWKLEIQKTWSSPGDAGLDAELSQETPGALQAPAWPDWLSR